MSAPAQPADKLAELVPLVPRPVKQLARHWRQRAAGFRRRADDAVLREDRESFRDMAQICDDVAAQYRRRY